MLPDPRSLEGFRPILILLAVTFPVLAAVLLHFDVQPWLILTGLALLSLALVALFLIFFRGLARAMHSNIQCAQAMTSGNYKSSFKLHSGSGLIAGNQIALQEMLTHFKHELSLSKGVMHSMVTPCVVTDVHEVFIFGNPALITMLEHEGRPEDYYGQDVSMFFYGEKRQTVLGTAMQEKRSISKEVEFTGRKGGKRNIHIDASPLYDIEGKIMGALCIYTDLTEIRTSEARLCAQNEIISNAAKQATAISDDMATAAEELSAQVEEASRGAEEQRARTTETATAMEEMNATVLEVARNASQAAEASDQASSKAKDGTRVVDETVRAIHKVQQQSQELKSNLGRLGQQAEQIGRIMNVIEDIADQTNLLALNAAIEAARAGDAGRGFAVVADEVRKLAEKTMNATKEVGQAIAGIQQGTKTNIAGMDQASAAIAEATSRANTSGDALKEILTLAELAADQVRSIATAAEQQSATSEEINRGVEDINRISAETSHVMNQSAEAVSHLARMAVELHTIIDEMRAKSPEECAPDLR